MLAYGVGNLVNDDWLEQVVKRGWTNYQLPSVLVPTRELGLGGGRERRTACGAANPYGRPR